MHTIDGDPQTVLDHDHFEDTHLVDLDLTSEVLVGKAFYGCTFTRVRLHRAVLSRCTFDDCHFVCCDLTMAKPVGAAFHDVRFDETKLMGVDWTSVGVAFSATFESCVLDYASFLGMNLSGTAFLRCSAKEAIFQESNLKGACFDGCNLEGALFLRTDLTETDLSTALNYAFKPEENRLRRTKFSLEAALQLLGRMGIDVPDV